MSVYINKRPYIIINGIDSRTWSDIIVTELPPISKPKIRTQVEEVDGRDGDIITPLGYAAYDKTVKIGLTGGLLGITPSQINYYIGIFNSSGTIIFSDEPTKYYRYAIYEQIDFERLLRYRTAEITFHVQPFKFSTTEAPIVRNGSGSISVNVNNSGNIYSRPELLLTGSGNATVDLNSSEILSVDLDSANGAIFIDSENMNAYGAKSAINNVIAYINAYQDGEGDPSPSNERTIHGFTELNIVDTPDSNLTELNTIDNNFTGVVNFNQYANDIFASRTERGITITNNGGGSYTLNGTANDNVTFNLNGLLIYKDHIYLAVGNKGGSPSTYYLGVAGVAMDFGSGGFWKSTLTAQSSVRFDVRSGTSIDNVTITPQIFDLTQLFGSTIADYIYNLERSQAGAGVAFFRNLYPNDYYDYNTGTRELMPLTEKTVYTVDISENPQDPDNPQVIYGGYYESDTGLLRITHGYELLNGNSSFNTNGTTATTSNFFHYFTGKKQEFNTMFCSKFAFSEHGPFVYSFRDRATNNGAEFCLPPDIPQTEADCKAWFAANPTQVCYELAEPIDIQLAPTQINNLIGLNQVFTDTNGDVAVDYRASGEDHFEQAPIVSFTCTFEDIIKGTLLNRAVTGNYDNIKLKIGLNNLVVNGSGVNQFAIDKYSRWL